MTRPELIVRIKVNGQWYTEPEYWVEVHKHIRMKGLSGLDEKRHIEFSRKWWREKHERHLVSDCEC